MYNTIVVGTDGSRQALDAVRRAGELARLCLVPKVHVVAACRMYTPYEVERIQAELPAEYHDLVDPHTEGADRFGGAAAVLLPMGIEVDEHEVGGDPADGILDVADRVGADLIVVGARGMGAIARFVRGSVSTRVTHHSRCDVLVVEHDHDTER